MGVYIDGFIVPVPKRNVAKYNQMAKKFGKMWIEYGALEYIECLADDAPKGKVTSFPRSVKLKGSETVYFSWIVYKSRADRKRIVAKVMKDPRVKDINMTLFDGKRMIYGGFKTSVHLKRNK